MDVPDDAYKDGVFANKAMADLERLAGSDQPFFLAVGFERPHLPYTAPKKYWDLYNRKEIELSGFRERAENDVALAYTNSGSIKSYSDEKGNFIYRKLDGGEDLSEEEQRKLMHGYKAAVSYIDAQVGMILQKLEELYLERNTIVVLWGDHGYHLYDHGMWGKSTNFEQATRSPLIIVTPGIPTSHIKTAVGFVDLFPTLCELTGIESPEQLAGESLVRLMQGDTASVKGYAISQFQREAKMGYAIRDNRYRYVEWLAEGRHEHPQSDLSEVIAGQLFDYKTDPLETVNVFNRPEYGAVQAELKEKLQAFYRNQVIDWEPPGDFN